MLAQYEALYGLTAEPLLSEWDGHDPEWMTAAAFEEVRSVARHKIAVQQGPPTIAAPDL
jgi:hypothetical protein